MSQTRQFLDSYFFGLESFDMKLGRDAVLDVVPVRDAQVPSPTQPPSKVSTYPMNIPGGTFAPKLMETTLVFRGDWIEM